MSKQWYIVHTYSGHENKAKQSLLERARAQGKGDMFDEVLIPEEGKKAMHVEFTERGDRALVSVWDARGAVVVYDAGTLSEVARLPYAMPVGKDNAWNKTRHLR